VFRRAVALGLSVILRLAGAPRAPGMLAFERSPDIVNMCTLIFPSYALRDYFEETHMPCFLFTYHAHGSWLPDRAQGYVRRGRGILPPDTHMHGLYTRAMISSTTQFAECHQKQLILNVLESRLPQRFEPYFIATDITHVHVLLSWRDGRKAEKVRALLKGSMTRSMNTAFGRQNWFVEGGSLKRVRDRDHFDYLVSKYLPRHTGLKWSRSRGIFK
jgi:hypothetical protein